LVHKISIQKSKEIEWGFDLTDVSNDKEFFDLLDKYGFKLIEYQKPEDRIKSEKGEFASEDPTWTWEKYLGKGRFKKYHLLFKNPEGIKIRIEHTGGKGEDKGALGYIGIKSPAKAKPTLINFLKDFRGSSPIETLDWTGKKGISRYVKKESPYESGFIRVD